MLRCRLVALAISGALLTLAALVVHLEAIGTRASTMVVWAIYAPTIVLVGVYLLVCVRFPSILHWFGTAYTALFLLFPLTATMMELIALPNSAVLWTYTVMAVPGIALFLAVYTLGSLAFAPRSGSMTPGYSVTLYRLEQAVWLFTVLHVAAFLLYLLDIGPPTPGTLARLIGSTREERKLSMGPLSLLAAYIVLSGGILYALVPLYARARKGRGSVLIGLLLFLEVGFFLATRARTPVILHITAALVGFAVVPSMLKVEPSSAAFKRFSARRTWGLAIATAVFALFASTQLRAIRGYIGEGGLVAAQGFDPVVALQFAVVNGELGYSPTVFRLIEMVPQNYDYLGGQSYYRLAFVWIPRTLWPSKPRNTGQVVGRWFVPDSDVHSQNPGIIGDLYINFGRWGVAGMLLFGLAAAWIDRRGTLTHLLLTAGSFTAVFHFTRGSFTEVVLHFMAIYLMVLLGRRLMKVRTAEPLQPFGSAAAANPL